jgi:hypothetical protein
LSGVRTQQTALRNNCHNAVLFALNLLDDRAGRGLSHHPEDSSVARDRRPLRPS